jgi:putative peptide zinc metalloprotease protein
LVPLPYRIHVPAWIEANDAHPIYVSVPGRLEDARPTTTRVAAGETIAQLASPEIEARRAQLASEVNLETLRLKNLKLLLADDPSVAPLIPAAGKALEDAQHRLDDIRREQERLVLRAPVAGAVLPPAQMPRVADDAKTLSNWHGTPLDEPNRGCYLETGTLVCQIGDPSNVEAMLLIEQSAIAFVRQGQLVRLRIDQGPVKVLTGTITELAKTDASDVPDRLARTLDLPMRVSGQTQRQAATYYQARVQLDIHDAQLLVGMHGRAKILADWQPIGQRLWRALRLTFRLA